jgi:hypothetical protein
LGSRDSAFQGYDVGMELNLEKKNITILSWGLIATTVIVYTHRVSDPVNAPKLLTLGLVSMIGCSLLVIPNIKFIWYHHAMLLLNSCAMILFMVATIFFSELPIQQNIYGVQGRNTGFLAQIGFLLLLTSILSIRQLRSVQIILKSLLIAGVINIAYCLWVLVFEDFIGWNNQYNSLLGTFGNPNFISSFLGMIFGLLLALITFQRNAHKTKLTLILLLLLILFEIYHTKSIQGFILVGISIYLNIFFIIMTKISKLYISAVYLSTGLLIAITGVLGLVGKGPLSNLLFQETFYFRLQYWRAGVKMGMEFPFTGVGMDGYGDWYRQMRTIESTVKPGIDVITNVAHNIYVDAFANGGFPLLIVYLVPVIYAVKSLISTLVKREEIDVVFVSIATAWVCHQAQSLISISQIGISIWGWILTGLLIIYPRLRNDYHDANQNKEKRKHKRVNNDIARAPILLITILLSILIYSPPVLADYKWTSAYASRNAERLYDSITPSYFYPNNSFTLAQASQIFESSKLSEQAYKIAIRASQFNHRNFDSWLSLYNASKSSKIERLKAKNMMIELDPYNFKWKNLE